MPKGHGQVSANRHFSSECCVRSHEQERTRTVMWSNIHIVITTDRCHVIALKVKHKARDWWTLDENGYLSSLRRSNSNAAVELVVVWCSRLWFGCWSMVVLVVMVIVILVWLLGRCVGDGGLLLFGCWLAWPLFWFGCWVVVVVVV